MKDFYWGRETHQGYGNYQILRHFLNKLIAGTRFMKFIFTNIFLYVKKYTHINYA